MFAATHPFALFDELRIPYRPAGDGGDAGARGRPPPAGCGAIWIDGEERGRAMYWHHLGTTRMHRDPAKGVVDEHCQVHGVPNLFLAGSSVFPTGGYANPTLTIVALALRLADRLKSGSYAPSAAP